MRYILYIAACVKGLILEGGEYCTQLCETNLLQGKIFMLNGSLLE